MHDQAQAKPAMPRFFSAPNTSLRSVRPARSGFLLVALTVLALGGCASSGGGKVAGLENDAFIDSGVVPKVEPKARYGNMKSYKVFGKTYYPKQSSEGHVERGIASWYGKKFHGRKTSSGERYDMHQMTAAHKTLPLPSYVLVRNLDNGRSTVLRVNDRGPFVGDRIIDLSYAAAKSLGVDKPGLANVEVISVDPRDHGGQVPDAQRLALARAGLLSEPEVALAEGPELVANQVPASSGIDQPIAQTQSSAAGEAVYLQVGAFGARDNAERLREQLVAMVQDPVMVSGGEGALYRVRVGPVPSSNEAEISRQLAALGIDRPLVIRD